VNLLCRCWTDFHFRIADRLDIPARKSPSSQSTISIEHLLTFPFHRGSDGNGKDVLQGTPRNYQNSQSAASGPNNHLTEGDTREKDEKRKTYDWFKVNADELVAKVSKRIEDLEILERTAQSTSSSVGYCSSYSPGDAD
jgi:hypothetical protein